ncbi:hypothetical protein [Pseudarthrobacter defluvii]|jgi:hypothetical protein|uniref:hypothetical protein n=1 Tax=Pseudarthrobacter defluvii TaxID=410837 RepID=UPI002574921D|nr:hypothetical protein [Pseudarthrobacter defluvii]WJH26742.1 hypothetical protein JCQ34_19970 [Pseudarthrobacter defluvii]
MNKKHMTIPSVAVAAAIALTGCSADSGSSMPGMNHGGGAPVPSTTSPAAASSPPATRPADVEGDRFRPPNNDNAPLTVGIAGALLSVAGGIFYLVQRRSRNSGHQDHTG